MNTWLKNIVIVVVVLGLISAVGAWYIRRDRDPGTQYKTAAATRGEVAATISATGTVEPEEAIDVGAQVQGRIIGFGKDNAGKSVDNNSEVEEGMVLALIDPSVYQSQVDQADAQAKQAAAGVAKAQADLGQYQAQMDKAQRDWDRAQKLGPSDALAQVDYDSYQSAYETAKANIQVGKAAVDQASASVAQAQAQLKLAKQNLSYCTIVSPVKGEVITRRVNIGQTVVSSLSAPSLFLIAKDLTRMQIWTAVNEADIGNIHEGQDVIFTVDAYSNRKFHGKVSKVRLDAQMTQNVVTYTVEITAENSDKALKPYMTANVSFQIARRDDALLVPNLALRWSPTDIGMVAPDARAEFTTENQPRGQRRSGGGNGAAGGNANGSAAAGGASGEAGQGQAARSGQRNQNASGGDANANASAGDQQQQPTTRPRRQSGGADQHRGVVWIADGNFVRPLKLQLGVTDTVNTEVLSGELTEGQQLVVGEIDPATAGADDARNPFAPQFRSRSGGGGGRGR